MSFRKTVKYFHATNAEWPTFSLRYNWVRSSFITSLYRMGDTRKKNSLLTPHATEEKKVIVRAQQRKFN